LFPGANKVFLDKPLADGKKSRAPPPPVNDLSLIKSEMIDMSLNQPNQKAGNLNGLQSQLKALNDLSINESPAPKLPDPTEVLGLISGNSELFLFENKVAYNKGKAECWL
jgi:hypothetical protein